MDEFVNEVYALIKKYQAERGMSFAEAIGFLNLMSDELSERCRKGWQDLRDPAGEDWKQK